MQKYSHDFSRDSPFLVDEPVFFFTAYKKASPLRLMTPAYFVKNCLVLELQRATPRHIEDQHAPAPGLGMPKATEQRQTQKGQSSQGQDGTFAELLGNHTSASWYP